MGELLPRTEDAEFTVEANPETVTAELVDCLTAVGVNRMSIGAQSFDPTHLRTLERWHEPESVYAFSSDTTGQEATGTAFTSRLLFLRRIALPLELWCRSGGRFG